MGCVYNAERNAKRNGNGMNTTWSAIKKTMPRGQLDEVMEETIVILSDENATIVLSSSDVSVEFNVESGSELERVKPKKKHSEAR